jgi:hypothetical protein
MSNDLLSGVDDVGNEFIEWKVPCQVCGCWTRSMQAIEICPDCEPVDLDGNPLHPQTGIAR